MTRGFTLIELMVALLLLGLISAGVTLSFAEPLAEQRRESAQVTVREFEANARTQAVAQGRAVRLEYDLDRNQIRRVDVDEPHILRAETSLPGNCKLTDIKLFEQRRQSGVVIVDISPRGWSRSYALHLGDDWITVAGLTGQITVEQHEPELVWPTRHDAD